MVQVMSLLAHLLGSFLNLMYSDNFSIKELEGVNFAKLSGDNNIIHIDKIAGYNSIFGHSIVHGVLVILKF